MKLHMALRIVMASGLVVLLGPAAWALAAQQAPADQPMMTSEEARSAVNEAIKHAQEAELSAAKANEALLKHAELALEKAKEAQRKEPNERLNAGVFALSEAIEHGRKGEAQDAREHVRHAIIRLSQAMGTKLSEAGIVSEETKPIVTEAIKHARKADAAGETGNTEALLKHAELALEKAKEAQRKEQNQRLTEAIHALGETIEHGKKGQFMDAREHAEMAITKLSRAAGLLGILPTTAAMGAPSGGPETGRGEVVVKGEVLKIDTGDFYVVKDPSGRETHLFVGKEQKRDLHVGDKIEAKVQEGGQVTSLKKLE